METIPLFRIFVQMIILFFYNTLTSESYLNKKISKKNKIYISLISLLMSLLIEYFRYSLSFGIYFICIPLLILIQKIIIKHSFNYCVITNIIFYILISLSEMCSFTISKFILHFSSYSSDMLAFYLYAFFKCIFVTIFIVYIIKHIKKTRTSLQNIIENFDKKDLILILSIVSIIVFRSIIEFWIHEGNFTIVNSILNALSVALATIVIYLYFKYTKFYKNSQEQLYISKTYNKTLIENVDNLRMLKHDYNNILQSINGYLLIKQYDKLEEHIKDLIKDTKYISSLEVLSPEVINNPALYGIITSKYFDALNNNIPLEIEVCSNINDICFKASKLSKILGILLDNAIEATIKSDKPKIQLSFRTDRRKNADVIEIKNSIKTGLIVDTNTIFKKGTSSKKIKSGLGLWEISNIISKSDNIQIISNQKDNNFSQTLIIEKK